MTECYVWESTISLSSSITRFNIRKETQSSKTKTLKRFHSKRLLVCKSYSTFKLMRTDGWRFADRVLFDFTQTFAHFEQLTPDLPLLTYTHYFVPNFSTCRWSEQREIKVQSNRCRTGPNVCGPVRILTKHALPGRRKGRRRSCSLTIPST